MSGRERPRPRSWRSAFRRILAAGVLAGALYGASAALAAAPVNNTPPAITPSTAPVQGQQLTEVAGVWDMPNYTIAIQWWDCTANMTPPAGCTMIAGATAASYTPTASDVGKPLAVSETATNSSAQSTGPVFSALTAAVLPPPPVSNSPPSITPATQPQQGQTLTEVPATWDMPNYTITLQWWDCPASVTPSSTNCTVITGATTSSYTPTAADVGKGIAVAETATNSSMESTTAFSAETALVLPLPPTYSGAPPTIQGVAQEGQTLTESTPGSWSDNPTFPTSVAFQWQDCQPGSATCANIAHATGPDYTLTAHDVGSTVRIVETASNAGGTGSPEASAPTTTVTLSVGRVEMSSVNFWPRTAVAAL